MTTQTQTLPSLDPHLIYAVDAVLLAVTGPVLLAFAGPLTQLVGWPMPVGFLQAVGLLVLPWAVLNGWIARTSRPSRALTIGVITGDTMWVVGSVALLLLHAGSLTTMGLALLAGQGMLVASVVAFKLAGFRALV